MWRFYDIVVKFGGFRWYLRWVGVSTRCKLFQDMKILEMSSGALPKILLGSCRHASRYYMVGWLNRQKKFRYCGCCLAAHWHAKTDVICGWMIFFCRQWWTSVSSYRRFCITTAYTSGFPRYSNVLGRSTTLTYLLVGEMSASAAVGHVLVLLILSSTGFAPRTHHRLVVYVQGVRSAVVIDS